MVLNLGSLVPEFESDLFTPIFLLDVFSFEEGRYALLYRVAWFFVDYMPLLGRMKGVPRVGVSLTLPVEVCW